MQLHRHLHIEHRPRRRRQSKIWPVRLEAPAEVGGDAEPVHLIHGRAVNGAQVEQNYVAGSQSVRQQPRCVQHVRAERARKLPKNQHNRGSEPQRQAGHAMVQNQHTRTSELSREGRCGLPTRTCLMPIDSSKLGSLCEPLSAGTSKVIGPSATNARPG
jgi:hypothetical protein